MTQEELRAVILFVRFTNEKLVEQSLRIQALRLALGESGPSAGEVERLYQVLLQRDDTQEMLRSIRKVQSLQDLQETLTVSPETPQ